MILRPGQYPVAEIQVVENDLDHCHHLPAFPVFRLQLGSGGWASVSAFVGKAIQPREARG